MNPTARIGNVEFGSGRLAVIAGPCLAESLPLCLQIARHVAEICRKLEIGYVFKASYDKANRTSLSASRGPGLEEGLRWLAQVRAEVGVPVISDVHEPAQAAPAGEALDALQIPAFLCRQTDLLLAAGRSGKAVSVKKGQFVAPSAMRFAVDKVRSTGNANVLLTDRGACFGYDNLVSDFRAVPQMRPFAPVIFDATHSVQQPGSAGVTGGAREFVPILAQAAMAAGADGLFLETHPDPDHAASDAASQWPLEDMERLLRRCRDIYHVARRD